MSFRHPDDYIRNAPYDDPTIILVLVVMGQSAGAEDGKLWPSVATLAKRCRISERRLREIMNVLIADGFIARKLRPIPGKRNESNIYRMYLTEEAAARKASGLTDDVEVLTPCDPPQGVPATHRREVGATHRREVGATHRRGILSTESSVEKDQLNPSLAPQAPVSISREQAPEAREGDFDATALRRDPLTLTLIACLGYEPATRREWGQWRIAVNDLHACGATSDDIPRAIRGYQATYPKARVTPLAIVGHWAEIQGGKPHDLAQLEISRRATAADQHLRAERERADAERRAQEEREVKQLLAEYGYADGR